ncbi:MULTISPECIES: hypothetical protein [unclassified Streptomyces]|uniref:hypothetical protein n=1 Tax=unclassified Streptomyces TaxID=2593676 RepID=UPI0035DA8545
MIEYATAAYGLRDFPYLRRELNSFRDGQDLGLWCAVDGWRNAEPLGEFVAGRAAARKPALVVIAGGSGTGRTSLANYLIHRWATGRQGAPGIGFDQAKLVVAHGRMADYEAEEQLWKWVLDLYPEVQYEGYEPTETLDRVFEKLAAQKPDAMEQALRLVLRKLTGEMSARGWALAGVIEDVRKQKLLTLAEKSFRFVDSLFVATVENTAGNFDEVLSSVELALDRDVSRLATLAELDGREAREVVFKRWKTCTQNDPPFREEEVENAFLARPRPIARILKLMEMSLVTKVGYGSGVTWPDDRLKFIEGELVNQIEYLDGNVFTGR